MEENTKKEEEVLEINEEITEGTGIKIAEDVIAVIAGDTVSEVPGVAGMAGGFAGGISEVVENMTGLKVEEVNVHVQGVNTNVEKVTETKNDERQEEIKE